jgi:membrane protease YdiL (CAAX protease family)
VRRPGPAATWAVLLFAAVFPTLATWLYFIVLAGGAWTWTAYAAAKGVQFSFPLVWRLGVERSPLRLRRPMAARDVAWGLGSGLGLLALLFAAWSLVLRDHAALRGAPAAIAAKIDAFGIATPGAFLLLAVFYAVVHSLLEEYYWRWFLFGRLRRRMPAATALVLSSFVFTAHHVLLIGELLGGYGPATWLFALGVAAGGALWAWLYQKSDGLYAPWLSHACADAGLMAIGYTLWRAAGSAG